MAEYRFVTDWHIEAPLDLVFQAILDAPAWPEWWDGVESVETLSTGDENGIGGIIRYTWKGDLPYRLVFDAYATRLEPLKLLEASVSGDVRGTGRWLFSQSGNVTAVRYQWFVATTESWMNMIAPLAHKIFRKNHNLLMRRGGEGLARRLNGRLLSITEAEIPTGMTQQPDANDFR